MVESVTLTCVLCEHEVTYLGVGNSEYDAYDDAMRKAIDFDGWAFIGEAPIMDICLDCAERAHLSISKSLKKREEFLKEKKENPLTGA